MKVKRPFVCSRGGKDENGDNGGLDEALPLLVTSKSVLLLECIGPVVSFWLSLPPDIGCRDQGVNANEDVVPLSHENHELHEHHSKIEDHANAALATDEATLLTTSRLRGTQRLGCAALLV